MKIYLVRHGETTGDIEDRYGGSYDDSLTPRGEEQLVVTAERLKGKNIQAIFHSPLKRAVQSAKIIVDSISVNLVQVEGLKERHYGILTGLTKDEAKQLYPEAVEAHKDPMNTDPEGESFADFNKRVVAAYKEILNKPYQTIVILAHGGSLKRTLEYEKLPVPDSIEDGGIIELN